MKQNIEMKREYTEIINGIEFHRTHSFYSKEDVVYIIRWQYLDYYEVLSAMSHGWDEKEADERFSGMATIICKFRIKK
jgi:hypothetical protein